MKRYDLIVIGTGAGLKTARPAAKQGWKTALIENGPAGGTCLNRGCIPSKMLIFPASLAERVRESGNIGLRGLENVGVDLPAVTDRLVAETGAISNSLRQSFLAEPNLDYFEATARFTGPLTLEAGGVEMSAPRVVIAAGTRPRIPAIPGLADTPYMTSTDLLRNRDLPKSLIVLGAGYIAAELGHAYAAMGTAVNFLVRSRFLRNEDEDTGDAVERAFRRKCRVWKGYEPESVRHGETGFEVECAGPAGAHETVKAEMLLVATGVEPCTDTLGLDQAGVAMDRDGYIRVDGRLRTTADGVWAYGDVIGRHLYRHTANVEGEYLARTLVAGATEGPLDYGPVPRAVFTRPEVAGVGLTETGARAAGYDVAVLRADYADSTNAGLARGLDEGFVKVLVERGSERVLGACAVGEEAATLVHLVTALMKMKGGLRDLREMIYIHPALPEVVRDAVRQPLPGPEAPA